MYERGLNTKGGGVLRFIFLLLVIGGSVYLLGRINEHYGSISNFFNQELSFLVPEVPERSARDAAGAQVSIGGEQGYKQQKEVELDHLRESDRKALNQLLEGIE